MKTLYAKKKPITIKYMTFDMMIEYALSQWQSGVIDGVPWSFGINGYAISHETNNCYIIETLEGDHKMTRDDVLMIGVDGEIYPCKKSIFEKTYEAVEYDGVL